MIRIGMGALGVLLAATIARADMVCDWNTRLLDVLHPDNAFLADASGKPVQWDAPAVASRKMAIVNGAMFNAVDTIDHKYAFYNYTPDTKLELKDASADAAASMAAPVRATSRRAATAPRTSPTPSKT
jgi:hypothetical protein